jgi:hypothetical protein
LRACNLLTSPIDFKNSIDAVRLVLACGLFIVLAAILSPSGLAGSQEARDFKVLALCPTSEVGRSCVTEDPEVTAKFGGHKIAVLSSQPADSVLKTHTIVVLDLAHSSLDLHGTMIAESVRLKAQLSDAKPTVIVMGETSENLDLFEDSTWEKVWGTHNTRTRRRRVGWRPARY